MTDTATAPEATQARETRGFETEAKQLLRLMIHSLYSNKEIFLRELISNAADATNKLRFEALSKPELLGEDSELVIRVETDPANHTVTITDNGIGMSREEVISHLGTIARSGTAEFLKSLTGDQQQDSQLIGQFGVGFYSAFIVADRVEVFTRRAGLSAAEGVYWESVGEADFTVDSIEVPQRGTRIVLHLKPEENEFADDWRLQSIIRKYSDHIGIPVQMKAPPAPKQDDEAEDAAAAPEWQAINKATALWSRPRSELKDEDYQAFYQQLTFDFQPPLVWSHNRVEGKQEYTSLLYVPAHPAFDLWNRDAPRGLKLYVQRTFILDQAEQFLPMYLRFVRGVVDSNDLPLNVSREILQQDDTVTSIRTALTRRVLDMLEKMVQDKPDDYQKFWDGFGQVLKEGPAEDFANREKIASLLRFSTTHTNVAAQNQTLADYVARMKPDQECIYYIAADNFITAKNSPLLEMFRERGIEVLLLSDRIDDWLMNQLGEVQGKRLQDVARGELQLPGEAEKTEDDKKEDASEHADVLQRMQTILAEDVTAVRASTRLRESPACLVVGEQDIGMQMRRVLESAGQKVPDSKPVLEINLQHPLLQRLVQEPDEERFAEFTRFVADQATLASGGQLRDPGSFVTRLNRLLVDALK